MEQRSLQMEQRSLRTARRFLRLEDAVLQLVEGVLRSANGFRETVGPLLQLVEPVDRRACPRLAAPASGRGRIRARSHTRSGRAASFGRGLMSKLFISHSSKDDGFVRELRQMLDDLGHEGWIDSRELRGGDPLWPEIQKAIEGASAYAVVVSTDALQSKWVGKELQHALKLRGERGKDTFPVIPLSLDGTKLGVLEALFGEEPVYIPVS